jgi:hypothetical protein
MLWAVLRSTDIPMSLLGDEADLSPTAKASIEKVSPYFKRCYPALIIAIHQFIHTSGLFEEHPNLILPGPRAASDNQPGRINHTWTEDLDDSLGSENEADPESPANKRVWLRTACSRSPIPDYRVKLAKPNLRQQLAIEWLTAKAQDTFHARLTTILGSWGVTPAHKGTCVLNPAGWAHVSPTRIAELRKHPLADSERLVSRTAKHIP